LTKRPRRDRRTILAGLSSDFRANTADGTGQNERQAPFNPPPQNCIDFYPIKSLTFVSVVIRVVLITPTI